jgi:hypothetical protein
VITSSLKTVRIRAESPGLASLISPSIFCHKIVLSNLSPCNSDSLACVSLGVFAFPSSTANHLFTESFLRSVDRWHFMTASPVLGCNAYYRIKCMWALAMTKPTSWQAVIRRRLTPSAGSRPALDIGSFPVNCDSDNASACLIVSDAG